MYGFYNFGYTMLLTPICKLVSDPVAIYRLLLFCNVIIHALIVVTVYAIIRYKLECRKIVSIAFAIVCGCNALVLHFKGFMYNEMPLALIVWITILLLLVLTNAGKKKRFILSAILGLVCAYAYLIHSRCVIVYGAVAVLVFLYLIVYRKWLVQPVAFVPIFALCISVEKVLVAYVQKYLYLQSSGQNMTNSVEHVVTGTWRYRAFTSLDGLKNLFCYFFSLSGATAIETGGLLTIVTVVVLYYMKKNWKKYCRGEEKKTWFVLMVFSVVSLWGMVFAIAMTGAANEKYRFLAYTRYFMPFLGPFLLMGMMILRQYKEMKYKWIVFWSGMITVIVGAVYWFFCYPIMDQKTMREITSYYFFMPFSRYPKQIKFTRNVIIIAVGVLVVYTIFLLMLYKRRQTIALGMAVLIFSCVLCWRVEKKQCEPASQKRYNMANSTYDLYEDGVLSEELDVYCAGNGLFKKAVISLCYDKDISYDMKNNVEISNCTVILSNSAENILQYNPLYVYQLDSNEWIGTWNTELRKILDERYTEYNDSYEAQ
jgi:hypothetical protein